MMLAIATLMAANSQVDEAMALANRLSPRLAQKVQFKQGKKKSTDYFTLSNNGDKVLITERMLRETEDVFLDDMTLDEVREKLGRPIVKVGTHGDELLEAILHA